MTTTTQARPTRPPLETVYFHKEDDDLPVFEHVNGLTGVCRALDRLEDLSYNSDQEKLELAGGLATAARILAEDLLNRISDYNPRIARGVRKLEREELARRRQLAVIDGSSGGAA